MIAQIKKIVINNLIAYRVAFIFWQFLNDLYVLLFRELSWAIRKIMLYFIFLFKGVPIVTKDNYRVLIRVAELSRKWNVRAVIDVGANDGWFFKLAKYYVGEDIKYIGFEPITSEYEKIKKLLGPNDELHNYCVGEKTGKSVFFEYGTTGVSSTKQLIDNKAYGKVLYDTSIESLKKYDIEVHRLDEVVASSENCFLKIDVQGAELDVLRGATGLLGSGVCKLVLLEIMIVPKYSAQSRWHELMNFMVSNGYTIKDIYLASYMSGDLSEIDVLFSLEP